MCRLLVYDLKKSFHIFLSTLLLLSISWQCGAKTVIYLNFKRHQKELAETVCENKDVVGSCCKAKCYLDKEIKKEEKRQADLPSTLKEKTGKTELFSGPLSLKPLLPVLIRSIALRYTPSLPEQGKVPVFHPPAVI